MKRKINLLTAILFAATLLLSVSVDSKGHFLFVKESRANVPTAKGPSPWYCFENGTSNVAKTLQVCDDEGTVDCSPTTPCPEGTHS
jgi:hypothetical protein